MTKRAAAAEVVERLEPGAMSKKSDELTPQMRAEDIILGALGYGEDASIVSIERIPSGFRGIGVWSDGDEFPFENEDDLTDLETWALEILLPK